MILVVLTIFLFLALVLGWENDTAGVFPAPPPGALSTRIIIGLVLCPSTCLVAPGPASQRSAPLVVLFLVIISGYLCVGFSVTYPSAGCLSWCNLHTSRDAGVDDVESGQNPLRDHPLTPIASTAVSAPPPPYQQAEQTPPPLYAVN